MQNLMFVSRVTLRIAVLMVLWLLSLVAVKAAETLPGQPLETHLLAPSANTVPVNLPDCGPSNPDSRILSSGADLAVLNSDDDHHVFCLENGVYNGATLTRDGSETQRRYLRIAPGASRDQVIITAKLKIMAKWWVIDGMTLQTDERNVIAFRPGGDHNIVNNVVVQHGWGLVHFGGGNYNVLQNSLLQDSRLIPDEDSHCVGHGEGARFNQVLNNEMRNCAGDGVQSIDAGHGLLVEGNEIYITNHLYSDCNGNLDPNGACACAEGAIDIKGAAENSDPEGLLVLRNNIFYGFRPTDSQCGGTGSLGAIVTIHQSSSVDYSAEYVLMENNILFDAPIGLRYPRGNPEYITIRNNLFANMYVKAIEIGTKVNSHELYHNTIINNSTTAPWIEWTSDEPDFTDIRSNLIMNSGPSNGEPPNKQSITVEYNGYLSTFPTSRNGKPVNDVVTDFNPDNFQAYCFPLKKFSNPQEACISSVVPNASSPVVDRGDVNLGSRDNVGIDDTVGITVDLQNKVRSGVPDIGAFENCSSNLTANSASEQADTTGLDHKFYMPLMFVSEPVIEC